VRRVSRYVAPSVDALESPSWFAFASRLRLALANPPCVITLVASIFCALIVIAQEPHGALIAAGDARLPELAPGVTFDHFKRLWDAAEGLGKSDALGRPLLVPIVLVDLAMARVGLSTTFINHFWPACIAFIQAYYTMRLFRVLMPVSSPYALGFVGVATLLNPLQLLNYHTPYPTTALAIALTPGLIATALAHLNRPRMASLVEFSILSVADIVANANYAIIGVQALVLAIVAVTSTVAGTARRNRILALLQLVTAYLASNLLIWVPAAAYIQNNLTGTYVSANSYSESTLVVSSAYSGLWDSMRLVGGYLFTNSVGSQPFIALGKGYGSNFFLVLSSLTLPVLALIASFFGFVERRKWVIIAAAATLVVLFVAKGTAAPAGEIFSWLFRHMKIMYALRDPYSKVSWLLCLGYILLAGYALDYFDRRLARHGNRIVIALSAAGLSVGAWPILTGDLFWPHAKISVPDRYAQAAHWFARHPGRILEMPVAPNVFDTYSWGYVGSGINYNIVRNAIVAPVFDFGSDANAALDDAFRNLHTELGDREAAHVLGLYGIRYILYDASVDTNFFATQYSAHLDNALPNTHLAKQLGPVRVYEVDERLVNELIYVPNRIVTGVQDLRQIGVACRILNGCRNIAMIGEDAANTLGHNTEVRLGRAASSLALRPGWIHYQVPPVIRSEVAPRKQPGSSIGKSRVIVITDYGNLSVDAAHANEATPLDFAQSFPVTMRVETGAPDGGQIQYHDILNARTPVSLCTRSGGASWVDFPFKGQSVSGRPALLALEYDSSAVVPAIALFDVTDLDAKGNVQNIYQVPLRSSAHSIWFARLFKINGQKNYARLVLRLSASGESGSGCAHFHAVIIAKGGDHSLQLIGTPNSFNITPPFVAYNPNIIVKANDRLIPAAPNSAQQSEVPDSSQETLSDLAAQWSVPEEIAPFARTFKYGILQDDAAAGKLHMRRLDTAGSGYDVHAYFGHLLPGGLYRVHFLAKRILGPENSRLAALTGEGQVLEISTVRLHPKTVTPIGLSFRLPLTSSSATVYFYSGDDGVRAQTLISQPQVTMSGTSAFPIAIHQASAIPIPVATTVKQLNATNFEIYVRGAPRTFLLAMLATSDPQWRISTPPGVVAKKVKVNLHCAGWIVSGPPGNYELKLSYGDPLWFNITIAATTADIVILILLIVISIKTQWQEQSR
jgi:hypothetical protein